MISLLVARWSNYWRYSLSHWNVTYTFTFYLFMEFQRSVQQKCCSFAFIYSVHHTFYYSNAMRRRHTSYLCVTLLLLSMLLHIGTHMYEDCKLFVFKYLFMWRNCRYQQCCWNSYFMRFSRIHSIVIFKFLSSIIIYRVIQL